MIELSDEWVIQGQLEYYDGRLELYHKPCINHDFKMSLKGFVMYLPCYNTKYECDTCDKEAPLEIIKKFKFIVGQNKA